MDAKVIIAPHVPAVTVDAGAASAQVSAADPVSVTIDLLDASGAVLGHVVLAAGSPFVSLTAEQDVTLSSTVAGGAFAPGDDGAATADAGTSQWGLVGGTDRRRVDDAERRSDGHLVRAAPGRDRTRRRRALRTAAADPVTGVDVTYGVDDAGRPHHPHVPHGRRVADGVRAHAAPPHRRPAGRARTAGWARTRASTATWSCAPGRS